MKNFIFLIFLNFINGLSSDNFEVVMTNLKTLENYIKEYINEKSPSQSLTHLIKCYIREGGYSGTEQTIAGGSIPDDLSEYLSKKMYLQELMLNYVKLMEKLIYQIKKNQILFIFLQ